MSQPTISYLYRAIKSFDQKVIFLTSTRRGNQNAQHKAVQGRRILCRPFPVYSKRLPDAHTSFFASAPSSTRDDTLWYVPHLSVATKLSGSFSSTPTLPKPPFSNRSSAHPNQDSIGLCPPNYPGDQGCLLWLTLTLHQSSSHQTPPQTYTQSTNRSKGPRSRSFLVDAPHYPEIIAPASDSSTVVPSSTADIN